MGQQLNPINITCLETAKFTDQHGFQHGLLNHFHPFGAVSEKLALTKSLA